jgi:phage major head subunit gpT-like protein
VVCYDRGAMVQLTVLAGSRQIKVREPVVLVPLSLWRKAEDLLEDQEALGSKRYLRRIERARQQIHSGKVVRPF